MKTNARIPFAGLMLLLLFLAVNIPANAADYFWVGGSGNWSDLNHWATTSGGTTNHTSVPSVSDDVFFNNNSFTSNNQTVTVNVSNAVCRNMNWTGSGYNPTLAGGSSANLSIYGSITLINNMSVSYSGKIYFEATSTGKTISTFGKTSSAQLYFEGSGGGYTLQSALAFSGLFFKLGAINTNSNNLNGGTFQSTGNASRSLTLGTSVVTVSNWNVNASNLTLSAASSFIKLGGNFVSSNASKTYNNLEFSGNGSLNAVNNTSFGNVVFNANGTIHGDCSYDKLHIKGNGTITGSNSIDSLIFTAERTYTLTSGKTQTINSGMRASATCSTMITIQSSSTSSRTAIAKSSGSISLNYVKLQGMAKSGNASFVANNSDDLGNNMGWSINSPTSRNLFWVGGSGNWNDKSNWATSACGSGGACLPNRNDNVFFAQCAFSGTGQSVTINVSDAACNNMTWVNIYYNPKLAGGSNGTLSIYGNLTLHSDMSITFTGNLNFEATSTGKTITTNDVSIPATINFNGKGGGWSFQDDFTFSSDLLLNYGALNTNNKKVTGGAFNSNNTNTRYLAIGTSNFYLVRWNINKQNLSINKSRNFISVSNYFNSIGGVISYDTIEVRSGAYFHSNVANTFRLATFEGNNSVTSAGNSFKKAVFLGEAIINGNNTYDTLIFTGGHRYALQGNSVQTINHKIDGSGTCADNIEFRSTSSARAKFSKSSGNVTFNHVLLQGIEGQGGATFTANNCVNAGNNSGWTINDLSPRTLYWVGNGGNWNDSAHWSLSSGGTGGECPPNFQDSVFFDANSFSTNSQSVTLNTTYAYCKNMDWTGVTNNPTFNKQVNSALYIHGSLVYSQNMTVSVNTPLYFYSTTQNNYFDPAGHNINGNINFSGSGKYTLLNDLTYNSHLYFSNGSLDFNGKKITGGSFSTNGTPQELRIESSIIKVTTWYDNSSFTLYADGSDITVNNYFSTNGNHKYNNLTFLFNGNLWGGNVASFNKVIFREFGTINGNNTFRHVIMEKDGNILGTNTFDTLTFSPGRTYKLAASQTQTITSQWNIFGNPCFPISLQSTSSGTQAKVYKASGSIAGDHIQIRDIQAFGGATFFAGDGSTNISNNSGWTFTTRPGFISGLGPDTTICTGDTLVLRKDGFNGGISFYWQNSTWGDSFIVTGQGTYSVFVNFGSNCSYSDNINVYTTSPPVPDLGNDTAICVGDSLVLSPNLQANSYFWSDSTNNSTLAADTAGNYWVEVFNGYCYRRDSINISLLPTPVVHLGEDTIICRGQSVLLDAQNTGNTFLWPNNDTSQTTVINSDGDHWVAVSQGLCVRIDTINVTLLPALKVIPRADTAVCTPQNVVLSASATGGDSTRYHIEWSHGLGSGNNKIVSPTTTTTYQVVLSDSCTSNNDTAYVTIGVSVPLKVTARRDTTICKGMPVSLFADAAGGNLTNYTFTWDNGLGNGNNLVVYPDTSTTYRVILSDNCNQTPDTAEVTITVREPLQVTVRADTTICKGQSILLYASSSGGNGNYHYLWDNGLPEGNNQYISPDTTATYRVILTDSCTVLPDTAYVTITVRPPLDVSPRSDTTICIGQQVQLNASGVGGDANNHLFTWNNGLGTGQTKTASPDTTTVYKVILSDGCTADPDTGSVVVTVRPPLSVSVTNDTSLCPGRSLLLQAHGTGGDTANHQFTWSHQMGAGDSKLIVPDTTTTYHVILTDNCTVIPDTAIIRVEVMPRLKVATRTDTMICIGETVKLYASGTGGDTINHYFIWDHNLNEGASKTIAPSTTSTYRVILTDSCSSYPDTGFVTVYVRQPLNVTAGPASTICRGESIWLKAKSSGGDSTYQYEWLPSGGTSDSVLVKPDTTTLYQVVLKDNCTALPDTDKVLITVRQPLQVTARTDTTICVGQQVQLTAYATGGNSSQYTFTWNNGLGSGNNWWVSPSVTTTYRVILSDSCTSVHDTDFVTITVTPPLSVIARPDTTICVGEQLRLYATGAGGDTANYDFVWDPAPGGGQDIVSPDTTTIYRVVLHDYCTDKPDTATTTVYVRLPLKAEAGKDSLICKGQSVQLNGSATGGDSTYQFQWDNGLGTGAQHQVSPDSATTYRLIVSDGCTVKNDTDEITIFVRPPLQVTARLDTFFCNGQSTLLYASASGGDTSAYQFTWDNGIGNGNYISAAPSVTTTYKVILSDGCTVNNDTDEVTLNVRVPLNLLIPSDTTICIGEMVDLHVEGTGGDSLYYTFVWDNGLGIGNNKSVSPDTTKLYRVILTDNCTQKSDTDFVNVIVRSPLAITPRQDTLICKGQTVHLNASATGGDSSRHTLHWNHNMGIGNDLPVSPDTTTTYRVVLTDSCTTKPDTGYVTIHVRPALAVSPRADTMICRGQSVQLYATASGGNTSGHILTWSNGVGQGNYISVSPDTTTTYQVVLSDGCSTDPDTGYVTIFVRPVLTVIPRSDTTICIGQQVKLSATGTGGDSTYTFTWNQSLGDGSEHFASPDTTTTYEVMLKDGCTAINDTGSVTITVRAPLKITAMPDTVLCLGQQVNLSAVAAGGDTSKHQLNWEQPLGPVNNITVTPDSTTTYMVVLTDNCTSLPDTDYVNITVRSALAVDVREDTIICLGQDVQLYALAQGGDTAGYKFMWDNGVGTGNYLTVSPDTTTTYHVVLEDQCSVEPDTGQVTVQVRPALNIVPRHDTLICIGANVQLYASGMGGDTSGYTFTWNNGLGSGISHIVSPDSTITYQVVLQDNCTELPDSAEVTIQVRPPLQVYAGTDTTICLGRGVTLAASATGGDNSGYKFTWDQGIGQTPSVFVMPTQTTTYRVLLEDDCTAQPDSGFITINVLPALAVTPRSDTLVCVGEKVVLYADAAGGSASDYNFEWDNGLGFGNYLEVSPGTTTTYRVVLHDSCTVNPDTGFVTINVRPALTVTASADTTICEEGKAIISAIGSGGDSANYTFNWDQQLGLGENHQVSPNAQTTYRITLTDDCSQQVTDEVTVSVEPLPDVDFIMVDSVTCYPLPIQFIDLSKKEPNSSLLWDFGDGNIGTSTQPLHYYPQPGIYDVSLKVTSPRGCTDSIMKTEAVTIHIKPEADFIYSPEDLTIRDPLVNFFNQSSFAQKHYWDFGDGLLSTDANPIHTFNDTGDFMVRLIAESYEGCLDTVVKTVRINDLYQVWVPNAFTPNEDDLNEGFGFKGTGIRKAHMDIYSRWGQKVAELTDNQNWNGRYFNRGVYLPEGVYVYILHLVDFEGRSHYLSGSIYLIK